MATATIVLKPPETPAIDVPYSLDSPAAAREWVAAAVADFGVTDNDLIYDMGVCISEVVTNALQHTRPSRRRDCITCRLRTKPILGDWFGLVVEVTDAGSYIRGPHVQEADAEQETGRGLRIVKALAMSWGHHEESDGRTTWFLFVYQRTV